MPTEYAFLEIVKGPGLGRKYCLISREIFIGRGLANNIVLKDEQVSAQHVKIVYKEGRYRIEDLESLNGFTLNGQPIPQADLQNQDQVQMGQTVFRFSYEA